MKQGMLTMATCAARSVSNISHITKCESHQSHQNVVASSQNRTWSRQTANITEGAHVGRVRRAERDNARIQSKHIKRHELSHIKTWSQQRRNADVGRVRGAERDGDARLVQLHLMR